MPEETDGEVCRNFGEADMTGDGAKGCQLVDAHAEGARVATTRSRAEVELVSSFPS